MPTIEIMSVRFNLDKEEDSKLFEEIAKHVPKGEGNRFLKDLLYNHFMKGDVATVKTDPVPKKQSKEDLAGRAKAHPVALAAQERPLPLESGAGPRPATTTVADQGSDKQKPSETASEAAGFAGRFMQ